MFLPMLCACQSNGGFVNARISDVLPITDKDKKLKSIEFILVNEGKSEIKGDVLVEMHKFSSIYDSGSGEKNENNVPVASQRDNLYGLAARQKMTENYDKRQDEIYSSLQKNSAYLYGITIGKITPLPGVYIIRLKTAIDEVRTFPIVYSATGDWYVRTLEHSNVNNQNNSSPITTKTILRKNQPKVTP